MLPLAAFPGTRLVAAYRRSGLLAASYRLRLPVSAASTAAFVVSLRVAFLLRPLDLPVAYPVAVHQASESLHLAASFLAVVFHPAQGILPLAVHLCLRHLCLQIFPVAFLSVAFLLVHLFHQILLDLAV